MKTNAVEILLIEDNPNDAELTIRGLRKNKVANNILHLSDGAEALEYFFATGKFEGRNMKITPNIVILDLKLPKVSGIEVLQKVKEDKRTKNIPVVVLTSSQEERDIVESYKYGANSYIVKPVDFDKFAEAIKNLGLYWLLLNEPPK